MKLNPFNTRIGLALGGGAAKGIAHIGVLKAFEEEQIRIHCISGTSAGALIASYYAFGRPAESILSICSTLNLSKIINFTFERGGLFSTNTRRRQDSTGHLRNGYRNRRTVDFPGRQSGGRCLRLNGGTRPVCTGRDRWEDTGGRWAGRKCADFTTGENGGRHHCGG